MIPLMRGCEGTEEKLGLAVWSGVSSVWILGRLRGGAGSTEGCVYCGGFRLPGNEREGLFVKVAQSWNFKRVRQF